MNTDDQDQSLGDAATFAGSSKRRSADASLGDERTLGGGDAAGIDTVFDDIEVVDLAARYKTEGTLGRGGMGEVLLALDTRLDRKVAIKRILGEAARSKTAVSRFLTEAKAIAALNHPHVVQIYDYGRAADGPFLIMEYVDGSSLLDRCRDGALPLEQAVDLACQLCDGLAKAHDLGIVHRDIKPANVLLTKDGLPKLTDFGLAKAEATDHQMTMTGAVLGTPDFMPPEQRKDAALVDHRSDLWSLAASLYQMVTGRSPKIIRFDLLPPGLTSVLGKALEESKDDRYQSAREFRDALKTSLVASAPAAAELGEGQCPACGVKNDSSRRFCRGCGEALEAPCLCCSKPMPMWEHICGQCGTKQAPLLEDRRGEMAARQAEAEGLLKDYDFDHAERITASLRDESDPRLKQLVPWATEFVAKIGKAREAQFAQAGVRLAEALKHEASFDYPSAVHALEQIPEILRSRALSGHADTVQTALARVSKKKAEVSRLERFVKERITSRELSDLLPHVRQLLSLRPDRVDVSKLCSQLKERQQKLVAQRDEAITLARGHLASKDYESAIAALRTVDRSVVTPDVENIRVEAATSFKRLQALMQEISLGTKEKQLEGLIGKVEEALQLKPGHGELVKLRDALQARETKIDADIELALNKATQLANNCRFGEAALLLGKIPEGRQSALIRDHIQRFDSLARAKAAAVKAVKADAPGDYDAACGTANVYDLMLQQSGISDPTFAAAYKTLQAARAAHVRTQRWMSQLRKAVLATAVTGVVIATGLWVRSSTQAKKLEQAVIQGRWDDALRVDPTNIPAYIGRAAARLASAPPDVAGAFADLDSADRLRPGAAEVRALRVEALVARAIQQAPIEIVTEAERDYVEAERLGGTDSQLKPAAESIAQAWIARAKAALDNTDATKIRASCDAARRFGADDPSVTPLLAGALVLDATALASQRDTSRAAEMFAEAIDVDRAAALSTLANPNAFALRTTLAKHYRAQFCSAIANTDWEKAIQVSVAAQAVTADASEWLPTAIAALPDGLSSLPIETVVRLPAMTCDSLPALSILRLAPLENSIGMKLKLIPSGSFMMTADGREPAREVSVTPAYLIGVHEVTNDQWRKVMAHLPSSRQGGNLPVESVAWEEVVDFCRRLSAVHNEKNRGWVYRLPTEAEWEYACRSGSNASYSFGDDENLLENFGWYNRNSVATARPKLAEGNGAWTSPVGIKAPNAWGLHDMHGNVREICSDLFGQFGGAKTRVTRGGGWLDNPVECKASSRNSFDVKDKRAGFRVAVSLRGTPLPDEQSKAASNAQ